MCTQACTEHVCTCGTWTQRSCDPWGIVYVVPLRHCRCAHAWRCHEGFMHVLTCEVCAHMCQQVNAHVCRHSEVCMCAPMWACMSTVQQEGEAETKQPPALQHMKSQAQNCKTDPGAWRPGLSPIKGSTMMVSPPGWGQFRGRACDSKGPS